MTDFGAMSQHLADGKAFAYLLGEVSRVKGGSLTIDVLHGLPGGAIDVTIFSDVTNRKRVIATGYGHSLEAACSDARSALLLKREQAVQPKEWRDDPDER